MEMGSVDWIEQILVDFGSQALLFLLWSTGHPEAQGIRKLRRSSARYKKAVNVACIETLSPILATIDILMVSLKYLY